MPRLESDGLEYCARPSKNRARIHSLASPRFRFLHFSETAHHPTHAKYPYGTPHTLRTWHQPYRAPISPYLTLIRLLVLRKSVRQMARLRLGYTKSRTGCLRCKQRRVKVFFLLSFFSFFYSSTKLTYLVFQVETWLTRQCDEHRPCRACLRHGVECSLLAAPPSRSSEHAATPPRTGSGLSPCTPRSPSHPPLPLSLPDRSRPLRPLPPPLPQPAPQQLPLPPLAALPLPLPPTPTTAPPPPPPQHADPFPYFAKFITGDPHDDTASCWVADLELLHHFTTSTCKTLLRSSASSPMGNAQAIDVIDDIWRLKVPREGFTHVFLLHQILATAAFHLAYLDSRPRQRQRYALRASQHQSVAIQGVRAALGAISPDNCHALFAASSLFFVGALAASQPDGSDDNEGPTVDDLVDIFRLIKGVGGVLDSAEAQLRSGPLAPIFNPAGPGRPSAALDLVAYRLDGSYLASIAEALPLPPSPSPQDGDDLRRTRAVLEAEVASLIKCIRLSVTRSASPEYRVIAAWPILMTEDMTVLLRRRAPSALALLAYYCVVMHATEAGYWFTRGWALSVLRDVARVTAAAGGPWHEHVAWAIKSVGGIHHI